MGTETRGLNENEFENYVFTLRTCDKALLPYAAVSALVIGMGARVGEVLALTVADVIEGGKVRLSIKRKISKKRKEYYKTLPFPMESLRAIIQRYYDCILRRYFPRPNDKFFSLRYCGRALSYRYCWQQNRELLRLAGIDPAGVGFHGLRKTYLTRIFYYLKKSHGMSDGEAIKYLQKLVCHTSHEVTWLYLSSGIQPQEAEVIIGAFAGI